LSRPKQEPRVDVYQMTEERLNFFEENLRRTSVTLYERLNELTEELTLVRRRLKILNERLNDLEEIYPKGERGIEKEEREIMEEIELRKIPVKDAEELIVEYVNNHPGSTTSDIFTALRLDPILVSEVLKNLAKDKKIRGYKYE